MMLEKTRYKASSRAFLWVMMAPSLVVLGVVILWPLLQAVYLSFTDYNLIQVNIGNPVKQTLDNYRHLLTGGMLWTPLANTLTYTFGCLVCSLALGLGLATLLNQSIAAKQWLQSVVLIPWMVPTVVTSLIWLWILNPQYGILNEVLLRLGVLDERFAWLANTHTAMPALVVATVWKALPFYTLMLLAGLQTVPTELYEAASMDGASVWAKFRFVTLPSIRRIIMVLCLMGTMWGFQQFTIIWTTTKGGPVRVTETLSVTIYREAFEGFNIGYASAYGILGLVLQSVIALALIRWIGGKRD